MSLWYSFCGPITVRIFSLQQKKPPKNNAEPTQQKSTSVKQQQQQQKVEPAECDLKILLPDRSTVTVVVSKKSKSPKIYEVGPF